jgi:hypothetical protein
MVNHTLALFLPGQMAGVPTDAVHRFNPPPGIGVADAGQTALEFTAGKAQLPYPSVAGGSKLKSVLMLPHMRCLLESG